MESHQIKIGSGLQNLGNTCFFNAVMQSVLHTKKLAEHLVSKNHSKNCHKQGWCVFCEIERTYHATRSQRIYSPYNLVNNLKKVFKKFKLGRQEDSHEFLRYLVEGMQDCQTGQLSKQREKAERKIKKTSTFNIFGGVIMNVVKCLSCKHKSITKQRYYDLNIECQKSDSLEQGLEKFFASDQLKGHNKYYCENCKNKVDATKRFYLEKSPQTFTFQLKRFTNMLRKIGKFIKYPKFVHMGKYFLEERKTVGRLSAVIVHAGSSSYSGHYYAFVRTGQIWYRMDDSYVTKCSEEQVMSQNAYILFYEKVKDVRLKQKEELSLEEKVKKPHKSQIVNTLKSQILKDIRQKQNMLSNGQNCSGVKIKQRGKQQNSKEKIAKTQVENELLKVSNKQIEMIDEIQEKDDKKFLNSLIKGSEMSKYQTRGIQEQKPTFQLLKKQVDNKCNKLFKKKQDYSIRNSLGYFRESSSSNIQNLQVPQLVARKRSKQQAQQSVTLQQMVFKLAVNLENLQNKLPPPHRPGYRSLRPVYNLRKYQIIFKKRKLC